jgi:hypothetical protein
VKKYFGVALDKHEAAQFFCTQFLLTRYRDAMHLMMASVKLPGFTCQGDDVEAGQGGTDPGVPTKTCRKKDRARKDTGKDTAK